MCHLHTPSGHTPLVTLWLPSAISAVTSAASQGAPRLHVATSFPEDLPLDTPLRFVSFCLAEIPAATVQDSEWFPQGQLYRCFPLGPCGKSVSMGKVCLPGSAASLPSTPVTLSWSRISWLSCPRLGLRGITSAPHLLQGFSLSVSPITFPHLTHLHTTQASQASGSPWFHLSPDCGLLTAAS